MLSSFLPFSNYSGLTLTNFVSLQSTSVLVCGQLWQIVSTVAVILLYCLGIISFSKFLLLLYDTLLYTHLSLLDSSSTA